VQEQTRSHKGNANPRAIFQTGYGFDGLKTRILDQPKTRTSSKQCTYIDDISLMRDRNNTNYCHQQFELLISLNVTVHMNK